MVGRAYERARFDVLKAHRLARITRQDDLVVGWPIAGRGRSELSGVIGFFANMLVERFQRLVERTFCR